MSELTPESDAMQPEGTAVKSALDKPLHQLTEDDIAQITREDCRRYLKEKGMRRPSWNKSQAIQQVIMLKTLLETTPDSDASSRKRPRFSRPSNVHNNSSNNILESVPKVMRGVEENSILAEEMAPPSRKDLDRPDSSGAFTGRFLAVNNDSTPSRTTGSSTMPVGQITIFYCGKVNVYDDVPEDKARAIMHIAASPQFPQEESVDGTMMMQPLSCLSNAVSAKTHQDSAVVLSPTMQTVKMNDDSQVHGKESNILRQDTPG